MSDFLTNLAARAIAEPTLRPRTRSRFEPVGVGEEEGAEWPRVQRKVALPVAAAEGSVAEVAAGWKPAVRPAGSRPHGPAAEAEAAAALAAPVAREVERDVKRVIETRERVVRVPAVERVFETAQVPAAEVRPHRFEEQAPRAITRERPGRETEMRRERLVRTTIDRTHVSPAQAARQQQSSESATPEPVVHVSIGRVEVRAVSAPPQQQRTAPRNARMTIDDYVARRKAKERR